MVIESVHGLHQADVALLNQIKQGEPPVNIFLGDVEDQPQVASHKIVPCLLNFLLTLLHCHENGHQPLPKGNRPRGSSTITFYEMGSLPKTNMQIIQDVLFDGDLIEKALQGHLMTCYLCHGGGSLIPDTVDFLPDIVIFGAKLENLPHTREESVCQRPIVLLFLAIGTSPGDFQDILGPNLIPLHLIRNTGDPLQTDRALEQEGLYPFLPFFDLFGQIAFLLWAQERHSPNLSKIGPNGRIGEIGKMFGWGGRVVFAT